jgi:hypothetical protein
MRFHRSAALTGRTLEALKINDVDASAAVTDQASPLELMRVAQFTPARGIAKVAE